MAGAPMKYLSGTTAGSGAELRDGTLGLLRTPGNGYRLDDVAVWAMDNGCFTGAYPGDGAYMALLDRLAPHRDRCLFVAVPDVVADARQTLDMFPAMATRIRAAGWPTALVGQDGMERLIVPWQLVDCVFIGGSTEWKLSLEAEHLIRRAKGQGKRVHVGRVNSLRRFRHFAELGCDTADGTYIAFGPDVNLPRVLGWMAAPIQERMR